MAGVASRAVSAVPTGKPRPRIAPPVPARSGWKELAELSARIDITLRPWQATAARYLTATHGTGWLYKEVAIIVARQNGKTAILIPLVVQRLLARQRIMHTAQNAKLPREVHEAVANIMLEHFPGELLPKRAISYAIGHEEIKLRNGGRYRIVAPTRGGARGPTNDTVIIDELREMVDDDFIAAAKPTLTTSPWRQTIYLSNAGTEDSAVLNGLRKRREEDPALAYLEWSASPEREADDVAGWAEANPSLGHDPAVYDTLVDEYRAKRLEGKLGIFETEHLCRWVPTVRERFVDGFAFEDCRAGEPLGLPRRPFMAVSMDPKGTRASAALAWRLPDNSIGLRMLLEATGSPIDTDALGQDLVKIAAANGAAVVGGDPMTDAELGKSFRKFQPISGAKFANASARFVLAVESRRLRWDDAQQVADDLTWTTRKDHDESGSFQAVRADDDRPITAALAAVRAVWLASNPVQGVARIW